MTAGRNRNSRTRLRKLQRKKAAKRKAARLVKDKERRKLEREHQIRCRKIIESAKHKTVLNEMGTARLVEGGRLGCLDCGEIYGSPRFPDFVIDNAAWKKIAPNHDEGGLLCPNCICARLELAGLRNVTGFFTTGPIAGH